MRLSLLAATAIVLALAVPAPVFAKGQPAPAASRNGGANPSEQSDPDAKAKAQAKAAATDSATAPDNGGTAVQSGIILQHNQLGNVVHQPPGPPVAPHSGIILQNSQTGTGAGGGPHTSPNGIVSPRDHATGLPTGKRVHVGKRGGLGSHATDAGNSTSGTPANNGDSKGPGTHGIVIEGKTTGGLGTHSLGPKPDDPSGAQSVSPKPDEPSGTHSLGPKPNDPSGAGIVIEGDEKQQPTGGISNPH